MSEPTAPTGAPDPAFFAVDEQDIQRVLGAALQEGADFADLYFEHSVDHSIGLEDGIISRASSHVDRGVGVRVVVGDQIGYAYSEDLGVPSMLRAARTAASIARSTQHVPPQSLKARTTADLYPLPDAWDEVEVGKKLPLLKQCEGLALRADSGVEKVSVAWADSDVRVLLATSDGRLVSDRRPMARLWVTVTAQKNGVRQSNSGNLAGRRGLLWFDEQRVQRMVQEAVDRTLILFDAKRPPAGELPVVLAAGASGILLHEAIGHGMEADFNRKGTSIYSSLLDQVVAHKDVTIVDHGALPHERGSINVDDEGEETGRTVLVQDGVLRSYLHDRISAKHYGVAPTGSGRREGFRHAPMPRMRCTYMENGPRTREEIIAAVPFGILAETFTNGQVQIGAGDFTFYIKNGWLIEQGRITAPIKDVNIIGNGPEALKGISMVGDDCRLDEGGWTCGKDGQSVPVSQGMPTVLVDRLTVGGEHA